MKPYDEESVLADYVWQHFSRLFTETESHAYWGVYAERAGRAGNSRLKDTIWSRLVEKPEAVALLADSVEAFRLRAARHVLSAHGSEIFINRCPACRRVVRTPKARQCFWCGHDWHGLPTG